MFGLDRRAHESVTHGARRGAATLVTVGLVWLAGIGIPPPQPKLFEHGQVIAPADGTVKLEVLAHTFRLGSDGPRIPITLGLGTPGPGTLGPGMPGLGTRGLDHTGADIGLVIESRDSAVGDTEATSVRAGDALAIVTTPEYGALGALGNQRVASDAPGGFIDEPGIPRAFMVTRGEVVPHLDRPGYGDQPSLAQILAGRVDAAGRLTLPPNQAIVAFEYTTHFHHDAADFQDFVVLVTFDPLPK